MKKDNDWAAEVESAFNEAYSIKRQSFFQRVVDGLLANKSITFNLADIPKSYKQQPFNLGAKLKERAGLDVEIVVGSTKICIFNKTKTKTKTNHRNVTSTHKLCAA